MTIPMISNNIREVGNPEVGSHLLLFLREHKVSDLPYEISWGYIHKAALYKSIFINYRQPETAVIAQRYNELEITLRVVCDAFLAGTWLG